MSREKDEQARRMQRAAEYRAARRAAEGWEPDDAAHARPPSDYVGDVAARADAELQQAHARGNFDNLASAGKQTSGGGQSLDPDWWVKDLIKREQLTGLAPAPFLLRKEDAELDETLDQQFSEGQVREILEEFNARIIEARRQLLGGPPVVTKIRDIEQELVRWRGRRAARAEPVNPSHAENRPARRPWWRRRRRAE